MTSREAFDHVLASNPQVRAIFDAMTPEHQQTARAWWCDGWLCAVIPAQAATEAAIRKAAA